MPYDHVYLNCPRCGAPCRDISEGGEEHFVDYAFDGSLPDLPLAPYSVLSRMAWLQDPIRCERCQHRFTVAANGFVIVDLPDDQDA